jgi:hypothetical protein
MAGERPGLGIAVVVVEMGDRIPLMSDSYGMVPGAERLLTRHRPSVPAVYEELGEQPQAALVAADRRRRQVLLGRQVQRPLVHVPRRPRPRVLVGERQEPADQPLPRTDRVIVFQSACRLLCTPTSQHRLDHRILRPQLHHTRDKLHRSRSRELHPALLRHSRPSLPKGTSCTRRDGPGKLPDQATLAQTPGSPARQHADLVTCVFPPV